MSPGTPGDFNLQGQKPTDQQAYAARMLRKLLEKERSGQTLTPLQKTQKENAEKLLGQQFAFEGEDLGRKPVGQHVISNGRLIGFDEEAPGELFDQKTATTGFFREGADQGLLFMSNYSPTDTIPAPDGGLDWGWINQQIASESKDGALKPGSIRLLGGRHFGPNKRFGLAHIQAEHLEDFKRLNFDLTRFLDTVLKEFTEVWLAPNGLLQLIRHGKPKSVAVVELRSEDGYYSVVSAYPKENPLWQPQGVRVWRGRRAPSQPSSSQSARTAQGLEAEASKTPPLDPLAGQTNNTLRPPTGDVNNTTPDDPRLWMSRGTDTGTLDLFADYGAQVEAAALVQAISASSAAPTDVPALLSPELSNQPAAVSAIQQAVEQARSATPRRGLTHGWKKPSRREFCIWTKRKPPHCPENYRLAT